DRAIDGITGATLSVKAMNKVVRIALLLDRRVRGAREEITVAS
ncbi:MAG TPA: FMN-binding protein, partial [Gammaproteobacteria bacterium]